MKRANGFTLLELMIVVAVIAILAMVALSGYQKQVRKSRRAEAKQLLSDFSLREEKYRGNAAAYVDCDTLLSPVTCTNYNSAATGPKYYTVAVAIPATGTCAGGAAVSGANSYTLTAAPRSGTDQAKDTTCGSLVFANLCGVVTKSASGGGTDCW